MKRINYFFCLMSVFAITLTSCTRVEQVKEEEPQLEAPYLRMKINGKEWVSDKTVYEDAKLASMPDAFDHQVGIRIWGRDTRNFGEDFTYFNLTMPHVDGTVGKEHTYLAEDNFPLYINHKFYLDYYPNFSFVGKDGKEETYTAYIMNYVEPDPDGLHPAGQYIVEESYEFRITLTEVKEHVLEGEIARYFEAIAGTFSGKMVNPITKEVIEITDGEFRVK
ncbi:MAG: hypothetical protein Q4C98_06510 [Capnocytophaga sp.]|nr:hypothetical protein [Capnocytophaga sp.]